MFETKGDNSLKRSKQLQHPTVLDSIIMASKKLLSLPYYPSFLSLRSTAAAPVRGFFGPPGRWDPFSDMTTAIREIERNTARMERDMDKFWTRSGIDRFIPSFTKFIPVTGGNHRITLDMNGCVMNSRVPTCTFLSWNFSAGF